MVKATFWVNLQFARQSDPRAAWYSFEVSGRTRIGAVICFDSICFGSTAGPRSQGFRSETYLCGPWWSYKSSHSKETWINQNISSLLLICALPTETICSSSLPLLTSWTPLFLYRLLIFSLAFCAPSPPLCSFPLITLYLPFPTHQVHLPPPGFLLSGLNHISSKVLIRGDHFLNRCRAFVESKRLFKNQFPRLSIMLFLPHLAFMHVHSSYKVIVY